jgi:glucose-1-phosphate adenylyltransferase
MVFSFGSPIAGAGSRIGIEAPQTRSTRTGTSWPKADVTPFGIMTTDEKQRIIKFVEKPKKSDSTLASMGIYVFKMDFLLDNLEADGADPNSSHDFGKNLIPKMVQKDDVFAYPFRGYWVDVGTIQAYWETSLALVQEKPELDLYDPKWVIHTRSEERPAVKLGPVGQSRDSLLCNGCMIDGTVINSVLSPGVRVERGALVTNSVITNDTVIRAGALVDKCVLDKDVEVEAGAQLGVGDNMTPNQLEPANIDTGITIVGKRARIPANAVIGRNCRIDPNTTVKDYAELEVPSGGTVLVQAPPVPVLEDVD